MADRTQLKAADRNDIAADDPFAELTRIMGFDPRQPVKPKAPAVEKASADHLAVGGDFDIDLEKELMGEFGSDADDRTAFAEVHEPAFETAAAEAMDDALAASLEQDFLFDDAADEAGHFFAAAGDIPAPTVEAAFDNALEDVSPLKDDLPMDDEFAASVEQGFLLDGNTTDEAIHGTAGADIPAPDAEAAFDDDFDNALASSLEDVSPLEDDLPMDDGFASSVEQVFLLDGNTTDEAIHGTAGADIPAPDAEAALDDDFHSAVSASLEEELTLGHPPAQFHHAGPANAKYQAPPVQAVADADHGISDVDLAGHFDDAMPDGAMDFEDRTSEPAAIEEPQAYEMPAEAVQAKDEGSDVAVQEAFDSDFDLTFNDEIAEEVEEPVEQIAAVTAEPTSPAVVSVEQSESAPVTVEPAMPAAAADERSLEDELNALLSAMTARTVPVAMEPVMVQPFETEEQAADEPTDPMGSLDWNLDEHEAAEPEAADPLEPEVVQAADADLDHLLLDELDDRKSDAEDDGAPATAPVTDINFDDEAFDAAFAKSIDLGHDAAAGAVAQAASGGDKVNSLNWLIARTVPPQPVRSWSRVTPVAQSQSSFAAKPTTSAPPASASPLYRDEPVEDATRHIADIDFDDDAFDAAFAKGINLGRDAATGAVAQNIYANAEPAPAPHEQPQRHDEMPDVETVDVPERVVALADDLDIPEINFDDDQPAAPAYDDLDAEFASLLTEMNATEPAAAPARNAAYDDDSYNAGFKSGHARDSGEVRAAHTARPAEIPVNAVTGSYADLAGGSDELPGSQPLSQANDLTVDGLDYDPELDEAMSVPGLAERDAARPRRSGLLIATVIGAVAIAGGLGAFALSLGGKGGTDAPVLVKADNAPIKVKPENPGGTVVPNQDNKVYDAVVKGTKPAEPVQEKLVTNTEEPVDVIAKEPQSRVVDLSPDDTGAAAGTDAAGNAATGNTAPGNADATGNADVAAAPKSEDRIAQVLQDADKATNPEIVAVAPRKVRTMLVKADGSLVPREDPAPAAPQVAAAEPVDPAPQRVAATAQADAEQTATVPSVTEKAKADQANADQASADQATTDQASAGETEIAEPSTAKPVVAAKPAEAAKAEANTQSANTPATVPVAPQRPSDQPVDVVGEVKPDQVASIDPGTASTGGGSWSMQIASQPTVESAQSTYQDLQRRYGSVLAGHTANIVKAEIAGKGTFYRVRVPAKSRNDAINLCTSYKAAGGNCFVSR